MKWYVTTVLMPDDKLYVGITEENYGEGITVMECDTEQEADELCGVYAMEHNLPTFAEYRKV